MGCEQEREIKHGFKVSDLSEYKNGNAIHWGKQAWEKSRFYKKNRNPILDIKFGLPDIQVEISTKQLNREDSH